MYYHHICQLDFNYQCKKEHLKVIGMDLRQHHQTVFEEYDFIDENVNEKGRCYFLT